MATVKALLNHAQPIPGFVYERIDFDPEGSGRLDVGIWADDQIRPRCRGQSDRPLVSDIETDFRSDCRQSGRSIPGLRISGGNVGKRPAPNPSVSRFEPDGRSTENH